MRHASYLIVVGAVLATFVAAGAAAGEARTQWELSEMFADREAFLAARSAVVERLPELEACRGHLGDSAAELERCLGLLYDLRRDYNEVLIHAFLVLDKDLRDAEAQQIKAETETVGVQLSSASAWMAPEILGLGREKVDEYLEANEELAPYAVPLHEILRQAEHTLPSEQEALLAKVGLISGKFADIYGQFTVSDMPYPEVELPGLGETLVNQAAYVRYRGASDRALREAVFSNFWSTFAAFENTLGTTLNAEVQKNWMYAQVRNYPSSLAAAYDGPNLPEELYHALIRDVRAQLPQLHRALKLRQRILGLETQKYSDIYASIVPAVELEYPWEEAKGMLVESMAPLGEAYAKVLAEGLESWIDVYPADGKENGAYNVGGWYEGHPWVLLNYNNSFNSLSTTAHEMGHALHSWHSNQNQSYPTSRYHGVLAEVASTFNETLLKDYLVAHEEDPQVKLFLLGSFVERMRQTVFRQTMFAEFELAMHRKVEAGETLTGQSLSEMYLEILRDYHGHDEGVMEIEDLYAIEWAYIPHFYRNFYVYQYATGMIAAIALAEQVQQADDPGAVERYLGFLSAGASDEPMEILRRAGADLTTPEPMQIAMGAFERALDQIEALLDEIEK